MQNPDQFNSYVAWPGDRPSFHGRGGVTFVGVGTSTTTADEEEVDQGNQDVEFDTDFERIMEGE